MSFFDKTLKVEEVFGISTQILENSYVDRGFLDAELQKHLSRDTHIALKGESKCGKSWLRQRNIPNAITVQCRLNKTLSDIYIDALSQLEIRLELERSDKRTLKGTVEAISEIGASVLAKAGFKASTEQSSEFGGRTTYVGHNISDLRFVADIINASGRKLVIEDFHYLAPKQREEFAFDLKALWDYCTYVVIIGIWVENNLLLHLNTDLTARVTEISIYWSNEDLIKVIEKGSPKLKIKISQDLIKKFIEIAFGTVGILQKLLVEFLDECGVRETQRKAVNLGDPKLFDDAVMKYADQLNAVYQTFASRVARGIRTRARSTGIYAHMLAVILAADDAILSKGIHLSEIFAKSHAREPRIQRGNLRTVLEKLDNIQVDEAGRGLIVTYDHFSEVVSVVDKQLLLYRRYATIRWPWEDLINAANESGEGYDGDGIG